MRFSVIVTMLALLTLGAAAAEEADPADICDADYDRCLTQCETKENGVEQCYAVCEEAYDLCLAKADEQSSNR